MALRSAIFASWRGIHHFTAQGAVCTSGMTAGRRVTPGASRQSQRRPSGKSEPPWLPLWAPSPSSKRTS